MRSGSAKFVDPLGRLVPAPEPAEFASSLASSEVVGPHRPENCD
jgi:hypothetical protein